MTILHFAKFDPTKWCPIERTSGRYIYGWWGYKPTHNWLGTTLYGFNMFRRIWPWVKNPVSPVSCSSHENNLVGGCNPSEKWWSSSVGIIIPFPTEWKVIKFPGSSHRQAVLFMDGKHRPHRSFKKKGWNMVKNRQLQHTPTPEKLLNLVPSGKLT